MHIRISFLKKSAVPETQLRDLQPQRGTSAVCPEIILKKRISRRGDAADNPRGALPRLQNMD
jgi:hypothetical protein